MAAYIEMRSSTVPETESLLPDMMHHLYSRQHLGKTAIVCDQPALVLCAARKQWLKLARNLEKKRASTLNPDKILKYTYNIAAMERLQFTTKSPLEQPDGDVFFIEPGAEDLPAHCFSLYIACETPAKAIKEILKDLPTEALVIDYIHTLDWECLGLLPKHVLETRVASEWQQIQKFLEGHQVVLPDERTETMDDTLDTLLGESHRFLQIAGEFQRSLELARPLKLKKSQHQAYGSLLLLTHQVQTLSPGAFGRYWLQAKGENPEEAVARHLAAGRPHLADAVRRRYMGRSFQPTR